MFCQPLCPVTDADSESHLRKLLFFWFKGAVLVLPSGLGAATDFGLQILASARLPMSVIIVSQKCIISLTARISVVDKSCIIAVVIVVRRFTMSAPPETQLIELRHS